MAERVSASLHTDLALDALEQALYDRPIGEIQLIHHSHRGPRYVSIRHTERLPEAGIEPSVGGVGSSYDNVLAKTTIGLYKTEISSAIKAQAASRKPQAASRKPQAASRKPEAGQLRGQ